VAVRLRYSTGLFVFPGESYGFICFSRERASRVGVRLVYQSPVTCQQYFSLTTNQPPTTSQQYFYFITNQYQPNEQGAGLLGCVLNSS
jgi:hypothetical protein